MFGRKTDHGDTTLPPANFPSLNLNPPRQPFCSDPVRDCSSLLRHMVVVFSSEVLQAGGSVETSEDPDSKKANQVLRCVCRDDLENKVGKGKSESNSFLDSWKDKQKNFATVEQAIARVVRQDKTDTKKSLFI